jgi:DNA polymerase
MNANTNKLRTLQAMGLGPVWQLRGRAAPVALHTDIGVGCEVVDGVEDVDIAAMDFDQLQAAIKNCTRCRLYEGRTHAVPGNGSQKATWLFIGEAPGHNEDLQGQPFVGPAGKLLDNMMQALRLQRDVQTYVTNIVKCRPRGSDGHDRLPAAGEIAACMPYLEREIALIKPSVIVALGKTAAASLLGSDAGAAMSDMREQSYQYAQVPLVVTYHPAYLLRSPVDKAKVWRDLCAAKSIVDGR